jgi:hypothetical protein
MCFKLTCGLQPMRTSGGLLARWRRLRPVAPAADRAGLIRVVDYRQVGHCVYEVTTESARLGRVTRRVLVLRVD